MTRATPLQIEAACRTRSADDAWRSLRLRGLEVSRSQCAVTIQRLIKEGHRRPISLVGATYNGPTATDFSTFQAEMGSKRLLAAHLLSGQHYIHDQRQMDDARKAAGL